MDSALAFHLDKLGSIPGWGNDEISSKFPNILFISKEILNAEISKIGQHSIVLWTLSCSEQGKALSCSEQGKALSCSELDKVHSIESVICQSDDNVSSE